jgi:protein TonB
MAKITDTSTEAADVLMPTDPVCLARQSSSEQPDAVASFVDQGVVDALGRPTGAQPSSIASLPVQKVAAVLPEAGGDVNGEATRPDGGDLTEATPNYRTNPLPEYPQLARQKQWQGVVWLLVDVSAQGLVDDVNIERSCGYRVLDTSARSTVQRWEFSPATRDGLPVESRVRIPVRFSLEDS